MQDIHSFTVAAQIISGCFVRWFFYSVQKKYRNSPLGAEFAYYFRQETFSLAPSDNPKPLYRRPEPRTEAKRPALVDSQFYYNGDPQWCQIPPPKRWLMAIMLCAAMVYPPRSDAGPAPSDSDSLKITDADGNVIKDTLLEGGKESYIKDGAGIAPIGFKNGALFLLEPPGESDSVLPSGGGIPPNTSDGLILIKGANNTFDVVFISDGASPSDLSTFKSALLGVGLNKKSMKEGELEVGEFFGFPDDSDVIVTSDVPTPEPATWLSLSTGLVVLLTYGWRWKPAA